MKFGKRLQQISAGPWADKYIDYTRLKGLLKENGDRNGSSSWTEADELLFSEELLQVQFEKVNSFLGERHRSIRQTLLSYESRLQASVEKIDQQASVFDSPSITNHVLSMLVTTEEEIRGLEEFSRVNFTGLLKAAKKHDRKRGQHYRVTQLLHLRLSSSHLSPTELDQLLEHAQRLESTCKARLIKSDHPQSDTDVQNIQQEYHSRSFWVKSEDISEVKAVLSRHLPSLVFDAASSLTKEQTHSTHLLINNVYFDSSDFRSYERRVKSASSPSRLRLRWTGPMTDKTAIAVDTYSATTKDSTCEKRSRLSLKAKHLQAIMEYRPDKGEPKDSACEGDQQTPMLDTSSKLLVARTQNFMRTEELQPVLHVNFNRSAFQMPGNAAVRIIIDSDISFKRAGSLRFGECLHQAHRTDNTLSDCELSDESTEGPGSKSFPHAILQLRMQNGSGVKAVSWIEDLIATGLMKEVPNFSKFVHGVAELFEAEVGNLPFWLSEEDLEESQNSILLGPPGNDQSDQMMISPPVLNDSTKYGRPKNDLAAEQREAPRTVPINISCTAVPFIDVDPQKLHTTQGEAVDERIWSNARLSDQAHLISKLGVPRRHTNSKTTIKVEPKVWLANQRTFIKWQHIVVLLASLSLALFNANEANVVAQWTAILHGGTAVFAGVWGWWIYDHRGRMIRNCDAGDFDNILGPSIICISLMITLGLNILFKL